MNNGGALVPELIAEFLAQQESAASARCSVVLRELQPELRVVDRSSAAPCIRAHLRWGEHCGCLDCGLRRLDEAQDERTKWQETKAAWAIATNSQQQLIR